MSAWQSPQCVLTLVNTSDVWHFVHPTFLCIPRNGYFVSSWLNSGSARIGFQLV
jgi:hypothetical protein